MAVTLKFQAAHSILWSAIRGGSTNVFSFVVFFLLARLLTPLEFGLFALATVYVEFTRVIAQAGLSDAVMRVGKLDEELADTVFWANFMLSVAVCLLIWGTAGFYAAQIREPGVVPVLWFLGALVPLAAASSIHTTRRLREFGHKAVAARSIASNLLGGTAAIIAALSGLGVWSLVAQQVTAECVMLVLTWRDLPWRPRLRFRWARLRGMLAFSTSMMVTQLLWLMLMRAQDLIIGRMIGTDAVGIYRVSMRIIDLAAQVTIQPVVAVATVSLARLQEDREALIRVFRQFALLAALFTWPAILGYGAIAPDLVPLLFGARWAESGLLGSIAALTALPMVISFFVGPVFGALNLSRDILLLAVVQFAVMVCLSLLAAPYGLLAVAAAAIATNFLILPLQLLLLRRDVGVPLWPLAQDLAPPLLAAVTMAAVLLLTSEPLHRWTGTPALYVAAAVPLGAAVYAAVLLVIKPDLVQRGLGMVRAMSSRRQGSVPAA
ncbi:lipopolysaccharide biosynthesis protein [Roseomonas sp. NAR14]|uniref:Lipopolysaccharide biosynthesis protein n=1 Tax=Roseomonas acroporae TaxID=2937791 RepID=A0A9X2BTZ0_9PROT|nr:lipopolysaccharide biosynthesis protein [Roseomonas acroporae]MCK8784842.1 lipopolysaccharide biosynthesis protein [Roseomonas acroporae]